VANVHGKFLIRTRFKLDLTSGLGNFPEDCLNESYIPDSNESKRVWSIINSDPEGNNKQAHDHSDQSEETSSSFLQSDKPGLGLLNFPALGAACL